VTCDEIGNRHWPRIGYDEGLSARTVIAERRSDRGIEILDPEHRSSSRQHSKGQWNWQPRNPEEGRKVSFLALTVNHDGTEDGKGNARRANGLFGGELRLSVGVLRSWRLILGQLMIESRTRLGGDRRDENQVLGAAAGSGIRRAAVAR
jgi:hypothetical protein